eukprot:403359599
MYSNDQIMEFFNQSCSSEYFNSNPDEVVITDKFGFIQETLNLKKAKSINLSDNSTRDSISDFQGMSGLSKSQFQISVEKQSPSSSNSQEDLKRENVRVQKWMDMLQTDPKMKQYKTYKRRPDKYLDGKDKSQYYQSLIAQQGDRYNIKTIFKDVTRTFTDHTFFKDRFGKGQKTLFCVLKALSLHDPEIGYMQGMGYMAGMFLTQLDEEDAFACMIALHYGPTNHREYFKTKMPGLARAYYIHLTLMKKFMPKLFQHLLDNSITPQLYSTQWFMTIFSSSLPHECILRIWDIYLVEGRKIQYRVALALLKLVQQEILAQNMEMDMIYVNIKKIVEKINPDTLIQTAMTFSFTNRKLRKIDYEYENKPNKEIIKYCLMS